MQCLIFWNFSVEKYKRNLYFLSFYLFSLSIFYSYTFPLLSSKTKYYEFYEILYKKQYFLCLYYKIYFILKPAHPNPRETGSVRWCVILIILFVFLSLNKINLVVVFAKRSLMLLDE